MLIAPQPGPLLMGRPNCLRGPAPMSRYVTPGAPARAPNPGPGVPGPAGRRPGPRPGPAESGTGDRGARAARAPEPGPGVPGPGPRARGPEVVGCACAIWIRGWMHGSELEFIPFNDCRTSCTYCKTARIPGHKTYGILPNKLSRFAGDFGNGLPRGRSSL